MSVKVLVMRCEKCPRVAAELTFLKKLGKKFEHFDSLNTCSVGKSSLT